MDLLKNLTERAIDLKDLFWRQLFKVVAKLEIKHIIILVITVVVITVLLIILLTDKRSVEEIQLKAELIGEQIENETKEIFNTRTDKEIADTSHISDTHTDDRLRTDTEFDTLGDIAKDNLRRRLLDISR